MLIYEKKVNGTRHFFYNVNNVPADNDQQVTFKDADGDVITPSLTDSFVDDGKGGVIRVSDGKFVAMFAGNTCIVPNKDWTPAAKVVKKIEVTTLPTKSTYTTGEQLELAGLVVKATYSDGDVVDVTGSCACSPDNGTVLETAGTTVVTVTHEVSQKTTTFNVTVNAPVVTSKKQGK